jgi:peroxiredoxin Q/BCP
LKADIESKGAVIIGISKDSALTHKKFAEKQGLTFLLLSDTEKDVLCKYGVWQEKKMCGKVCMGTVRTTFIIDEMGNVEKIFEKVKPETDAQNVLEYLSSN